jgi:PBSX family phage portal protein
MDLVADNSESYLASRVIKSDGDKVLPSRQTVHSNAFALEDDFANYYQTTDKKDGALIAPPYNQAQLRSYTHHNHILLQAITAMEVNIDGSGYDFVRKDGGPLSDADDKALADLTSFFQLVYPGMSFLTLRRQLRRDLEETGNAYLEVLRSLQGKIVYLTRIDPVMLRLVRLDGAVRKDVKLNRGGEEISVPSMVRERRFAQISSNKLSYFKEYGSERTLARSTGVWNTVDTPTAPGDEATEIIHFTVVKDASTPYGIPRWINNLPSVIGTRQAEETNLDYFDRGGVPPVMLILTGGVLAAEAEKAVKEGFSTKATGHNAFVLEAYAAGGGLDSAGRVDVKVEKFGSEGANDSQFETYIGKGEDRIRGAFRLPSLFFGKAEAESYATAFANVLVAETQVFAPERLEFDETISNHLLVEMGYPDYVLRSRPIVLHDSAVKLKAIEMARTSGDISGQTMVDSLNEVAGMTLTYEDTPTPKMKEGEALAEIQSRGPNAQIKPPMTASSTLNKSGDLRILAKKYATSLGWTLEPLPTSDERATITKAVNDLDPDAYAVMEGILHSEFLSDTPSVGLMALTGEL